MHTAVPFSSLHCFTPFEVLYAHLFLEDGRRERDVMSAPRLWACVGFHARHGLPGLPTVTNRASKKPLKISFHGGVLMSTSFDRAHRGRVSKSGSNLPQATMVGPDGTLC